MLLFFKHLQNINVRSFTKKTTGNEKKGVYSCMDMIS